MKAGAWLVAGAFAALLFAGCAETPAPATSSGTTPQVGHEHSVFRMFVDGEEISFNRTRFDYQTTRYARAHLHLTGSESTSSQYVIHEEGQLGANLTEFFSSLHILVEPDRITLNSQEHGGRSVANTASMAWQVWLDACDNGDGQWTRLDEVGSYSPADLDRMLVTYAPRGANAEALQYQFEKVPTGAALASQLHSTCD